MELVYLYIERAYGEKYDLHVDFSQNLKIRWDKSKAEFTVKELTSSIPSNFFSKNVTTVTGIVGKNGSGKTTIVNTLLLLEQGDYLKNSWLMILKKDDRYYIEGTIEKAIAKEICRRPYLFAGKISTTAPRKFIEDNFFQENDMQQKLCFLGLMNERDSHKGLYTQFQRMYGTGNSYMSVYDFLYNNQSMKNFSISKKLSPYITIGKPNFFDDNNKLPPEILVKSSKFIDELKSFWRSRIVPEMIDNKEVPSYKDRYLNTFSRYIFDFLFSYILFFQKKIIEDRDYITDGKSLLTDEEQESISTLDSEYQQLEKLEEIVSNSSSLQNINLLADNIELMLKKLDIFVSRYQIRMQNKTKRPFEFKAMLEIFKRLPDSCFEPKGFGEYYADFSKEREAFGELLSMIDIWNFEYAVGIHRNKIICDFGKFSAGEMQLIKIFSSLNTKLVEVELEGYTHVILVLDEYEEHLHPEWARKFLSYLLSFLTIFESLKVQLVLTTHSPYLVSDLPRENLVLIENNQETGKRETRKSRYGLASNYYDIMHDSFFLDDTVGEFAKNKIDECIIEINNIHYEYLHNIVRNEDEEFESDQDLDSHFTSLIERLKIVTKVVNLVDDQFIRAQLDRMVISLDEKLLSASSKIVMNNELKDIEDELKNLEEKRLFLQKKLGANDD